MKQSNLRIEVGCVVKRATRAIDKLSFSFHMALLKLRKASKSNNQRKRNGEPMIRERAYIKAFKNRH